MIPSPPNILDGETGPADEASNRKCTHETKKGEEAHTSGELIKARAHTNSQQQANEEADKRSAAFASERRAIRSMEDFLSLLLALPYLRGLFWPGAFAPSRG